jgi:2,3-bisphosphoglycerate-independent phosphoglycerate mutase
MTHLNSPNRPVCLLVLDGWGLSANTEHNAIALAETPTMDRLFREFPHTQLKAHGDAVGMPKDVLGNSEVGHLTLGAGRAIPHARVKMDKLIEDGTLESHPAWEKTIAHVKKHKSTLHLAGLFSTGGVHSHLSHLAELLGLAKDAGLHNVRIHGFTDGRDMQPFTAMGMVEDVDGALYDLDYPQIATLTGRYYAMDRDERWDRTQTAFDAMVHAKGKRQFLGSQAVKFALADDITDEFIPASVTDLHYEGMENGDAVLFFNFRPDRMIQLASAFADPAFDGFDRGQLPNNLHIASLVDYGQLPAVDVFFPREAVTNTLGEYFANADLKQFRVAETEKYAHVTYFFNGGQDNPHEGEDRCVIPSRRDVDTYDEAPAMRVYDVTKALIEAMASGDYSFLLCNLANVDMVGHTGNLEATIKAVEHVDEAVDLIVKAAKDQGVHLLITADHGNGERMAYPDGTPDTAHTTNPVPLLYVPVGFSPDSKEDVQDQLNGLTSLADLAIFIKSLFPSPVHV